MPDQPNQPEAGEQPFILSATYASTTGNEPFTISSPLSAPFTTGSPVESKSEYLKRLRASVLTVQDQVNKKLTELMEQDNLKASQATGGVIVDSKEEENYGEEM